KNIKPYVDHQDDIQEQINQKEIAYKENQGELEKTLKTLEDINKRWQVQQDRKEKDVPKLVEKKHHLNYAIEKEKQSKGLEKQVGELEKKEKKLDQLIKIDREKLKQLDEEI